MKRVEIDPESRRGRFGAGLTWAELDAATQAHGLAVTGGSISHTGVVTEFELQLHPVGPVVHAGMILHPRAAAVELLRYYRDFMQTAPDEVCGGFALLTAPPDDSLPEHVRGQRASGLVVLYAGDLAT